MSSTVFNRSRWRGGTAVHSAIRTNVIAALAVRLRGKKCRPHGSELKILVSGRIRYPKAFVVRTPVAPNTKVVSDPVVVFEVLSNGSENQDLVVKNEEYRETLSIQRYVVFRQTHAAALVFSRKDQDWVMEFLSVDETVIALPEIGIEIPLAEIYADVVFETVPDLG